MGVLPSELSLMLKLKMERSVERAGEATPLASLDVLERLLL